MSATIRIGYVDRGSEKAAVVEVESVLDAHGYRLLRQRGDQQGLFALLARGDLDLLVSAWLPDSDAEFVRELGNKVVPLATLYEPRCIWGVPDHIPESEVAAISDLLKPDIAARMETDIEAVADTRLRLLSLNAMAAYGLDGGGYRFREVVEEDRIGRFVEDVAERKWFVIPLWQPHWLHHRYSIRALRDPSGALGIAQRATLMASGSALDQISTQAIAAIGRLHLDNARLNELDDHLQPWD